METIVLWMVLGVSVIINCLLGYEVRKTHERLQRLVRKARGHEG